jgi:hypothetical protein
MDENQYPEIINHLKDSYQNAQSIIKFIDTKTSIVLGLSSTLICLLMSGIISNKKIIIILKCVSQEQGLLFYISTLFFCSTLLCFLSSLLSLISRVPSKTYLAILFPYYSRKRLNIAKEYIENLFSNFNTYKIIDEYKNQIIIVGKIIAKKAFWNRVAIITFIIQLISILIGFYLIMI